MASTVAAALAAIVLAFVGGLGGGSGPIVLSPKAFDGDRPATAGRLYALGANRWGQLGNAIKTGTDKANPTPSWCACRARGAR